MKIPVRLFGWSAGGILSLTMPLSSLAGPASGKSLGERDTLTGDWAGLRPALAERGIDFTAIYTAEVFGNPIGGQRQGAVYNGLVELALDVNFEKLWRVPGLRAHVDGLYPHGESFTDHFVGDLGVASSLEFYNSPRLFEAWLEQSFFDGRFSIRAGQIAMDQFYCGCHYASYFINSGFGVPTALSANMPVPIYAITGLGVRVHTEPAPGWHLDVAVFDGNPAPGALGDFSPNAVASTDFNRHGTDYALRKDEGALWTAEVGWAVNQPVDKDEGESGKSAPRVRLTGSYKVGAAYHTDSFSNIYDSTLRDLGASIARERPRDAGQNFAVFGIIDQELWRVPGREKQGLAAFVRGVWVPRDRNFIDYSVESGILYTGLIPGRDADEFGFAYAHFTVSEKVGFAIRAANRADATSFREPEYEDVLEATYRFHATPWLTIQPDAQWIIHPGGTREYGNALALGLRTTIVF